MRGGIWRVGALLTIIFIILSAIPVPTVHHSNQEVFSEPIAVSVSQTSSLPLDAEITWYSRDYRTPRTVNSGDVLVGDRITILGTYDESSIVGPWFETTMSLTAVDGFYNTTSRTLVIPDRDYDPYSGVVNIDQFDVVYVKGLERGSRYTIEGFSSRPEGKLFAWPGFLNLDELTYRNNMLDHFPGPADSLESYPWLSYNDTLILAMYNFDRLPGNWSSRVREQPYGWGFGGVEGSIEVSAYHLDRNVTVDIEFRVLTFSPSYSQEFIYNLYNVSICGYFSPIIEALWVVEDDAPYTKRIRWRASDLNEGDEHTAEVYLSNNGGLSYHLMQSGITDSFWFWNSTNYLKQLYQVKVVVSDSNNFWNERVTTTFEAGTDSAVDLSNTLQSNLLLNSPDDVYLYQTSSIKSIVWSSAIVESCHYVIWQNSTEIERGLWNNGSLSIPLYGLELGVYEYRLSLYDDVGFHIATDIVVVNQLFGIEPVQAMSIGITASSLGIIIVGAVLIIRFKKKSSLISSGKSVPRVE
ncbi:MAG: hypothetical protein ACW98Y_20710 [Candidatus Thorarchaeota archaeon]|jgi:hypothetical protein